MTFADALTEAFTNSARITRREWRNSSIYGVVVDSRLQIKLADGLLHDWILTEGDWFGDDWEVVE
jgi:hypothetical protein